ncbi:hypothetical protein CERZMDRAFT_103662 [Cercospora zeae-maydis SCOH1-5]|uniref:Cell wall protein PhiA n=1 Tax=Cercospora zeae-maydis SCOH1-5 TaxID=717836 RepID=A0A6A6EWV0_9PEZI|nr:hypothetical protein CERZMDRAFT_103662 [Cercospora zeae-maydis SCOH1-5]
MYSVLAIAFATLAAAAPAPQACSNAQDPLRVLGTGSSPGSQIDGQTINADLGTFTIGGRPSGILPAPVGDKTEYNTNSTIFTYVNEQGELGLSVAVPGGQRVFVDSGDDAEGYYAGVLRYTEATTQKTTSGPPLYKGFTNVHDATLKFEGKDWIGCPVDSKGQVLAIYAASRISPKIDQSAGCVDFQFKLNQEFVGPKEAWAYKFNPGA